VVVYPPNNLEYYWCFFIGWGAPLTDVAQLEWFKFYHLIVVAHHQVVYHLFDLGVVIVRLSIPNTLHDSYMDLFGVFVCRRKVLSLDLLVNCVVFRLVLVSWLLLIIFINHESVCLKACVFSPLEAKVLLDKGLIHLLKLWLPHAFSVDHFLVQYL